MLTRSRIFSMISVVIILSAKAFSQEVAFNDSTSQRNKIFVIPVVFYAPETNWGFGAAGIAVFHFRNDSVQYHPSNIQFGMAYTLKKQVLVYLPYQIYFQKHKELLYGELGYYIYNYNFYGIGNSQPKGFMETYGVTYPRIRLTLLQNTGNKFYIGIRYWSDNFIITYKSPGGELANGNITGRNGGLSSGLGTVINYDSRNNLFSPSHGAYIEAVLYTENKFTFSDFNFISSSFDIRKYVEIVHNNILAVNFIGIFNSGNIPFYEMAMLGGSKNMRGFYQGRYRDYDEIVFQPEYRMSLYKRFGAALFGGVGEVESNIKQFNTSDIRYTLGGGIRFLLDKKQKVNLRLDAGYTEGTINYYFTIGEAF